MCAWSALGLPFLRLVCAWSALGLRFWLTSQSFKLVSRNFGIQCVGIFCLRHGVVRLTLPYEGGSRENHCHCVSMKVWLRIFWSAKKYMEFFLVAGPFPFVLSRLGCISGKQLLPWAFVSSSKFLS